LRSSGAGAVVAAGAHGVYGSSEARVLGPEAVDVVAGFGDSFAELSGIEADDEVCGALVLLLLENSDFEGGEQLVFVDAVHAFSPEGVFKLDILSNNADAEDHGEDDGGGGLLVGVAVAGEGIEVGVCGGVVALTWGSEGARDGAGSEEEVEGVGVESGMEVLGPFDFGGGRAFPVLVGHVVK